MSLFKKIKEEWQSHLIATIIGAIISLSIGSIFNNLINVFARVVNIEYAQHFIITKDKHDQGLKTVQTKFLIDTAFVENVNNKGNLEIIVITKHVGETKPGYIMIFNQKMKLLWESNSYPKEIFTHLDSIGKGNSKKFDISKIFISDPETNLKDKSLIILAVDPTFFASRLFEVDLSDYSINTDYCHFGRLFDFRFEDINGDNSKEIIGVGYSNFLGDVFNTKKYVPIIFAVERNKIGQLYTQDFSKRKTIPALWYNIVPPMGEEVSIVLEKKHVDDIIITAKSEAGISYEFNNKGELLRSYLRGSWEEHYKDSLIPYPSSIVRKDSSFILIKTPNVSDTINIENL